MKSDAHGDERGLDLYPTSRPTVSALEEILGKEISVLDKGFIRVVDYMGNDAAIVQAARVSYGKGTKSTSEDAALIKYLMQHLHTTPFEMCEIKLHVKLPIFVARQWVRHRTANINEYSARYSVLEREFYVPSAADISEQSTSNKQGRGGSIPSDYGQRVRELMIKDAEQAFDRYEGFLQGDKSADEADTGAGIARELARIGLPLSTYTQWYWKIDLHNLFHFLRLRSDNHAQLEVRLYAQEILKIVERWVPQAYAAFLEHQIGGTRLSKSAVETLSRLLRGEKLSQLDSGLSRREWVDLMKIFDAPGG